MKAMLSSMIRQAALLRGLPFITVSDLLKKFGADTPVAKKYQEAQRLIVVSDNQNENCIVVDLMSNSVIKCSTADAVKTLSELPRNSFVATNVIFPIKHKINLVRFYSESYYNILEEAYGKVLA